MERGQVIHLRCRLSRSGFSNERVVRVTQFNGEECVGVAPVHYCWSIEGVRLGDSEPSVGQRIDGLVAGRVMANGGDTAKVELPDGQLIEIPAADARKRVVEPYPHVPV